LSAGDAYRGRFAPSPTGPLHLGSLVAALGSWLDARHHQGSWLIRIEDIDPPREQPGASAAQLHTLGRLGLTSDEPVVRQSARSALYDAALERLRASGELFECRCSRADLTAMGGVHSACVARPRKRQPALRLRVPDQTIGFPDRCYGPHSQHLREGCGDVVLRRAEGLYAYQLAVVVDDAAQGITDVVRGADLLDSTARQIALQRALGIATPRYLHLPLLLDDSGGKLSKSSSSLPLRDDEPLQALRRAWQFLLPALPQPAGSTVGTWLDNAASTYLPDALRREHAAIAVTDEAVT
jgi:glutamyl-Q tRNA(Asp) synthetase